MPDIAGGPADNIKLKFLVSTIPYHCGLSKLPAVGSFPTVTKHNNTNYGENPIDEIWSLLKMQYHRDL